MSSNLVKIKGAALFATHFHRFFLTLFLTVSAGSLAQAGTIALFAPLTGDYQEIGKQFKLGAELALKDADSEHELKMIDTACDGTIASDRISEIDATEISIMAGFYCNDAATAVASKFADTSTPLLITGARSVRLIKDRDRESWNLWRMSPGDDYPTVVSASAILERWKNKPFALVDDGTIYGRTFSDTLRSRLSEADLEPQFSDTFRAAQSTQAGLLRRLQRSGVTAAFIASATTEDMTTIARDAAQLDIDLEIITTEAMMVLPFLEEAQTIPAGLKVIGWPQPTSSRLEAILQNSDIRSELAIYQGFATVEIVLAALASSPEETTARLSSQSFNTVLGKVRFNPNGSSSFNPYRLLEWNGNALVPAPSAATQ